MMANPMNDDNGDIHWPPLFCAPPDEPSGRTKPSAEAMAPLNAIQRRQLSPSARPSAVQMRLGRLR